MNMAEVRAKFPQYEDLSDEQLLQGIHRKSYSDVPYEQFKATIEPTQMSLDERRAEAGQGNTLQVFNPFGDNFDTGIGLSQGANEALAGMGQRFAEIGTLGTHETDSAAEELLDDSGYAMAGGAVADIATGALGGSALKGAGLVKGALAGAGYGAATNNDRTGAALAGGLGNAGGKILGDTLGKVIAPKITEGGKAILKRGDEATPGELLGGMVKAVEDKSTSIPLVGDSIIAAKNRSLKQYSKSIVNEVLEPISKKLSKTTKPGAESIEEAQKLVSKEYDRVLNGMDVELDQPFADAVGGLRSLVSELPEKEAKEFDRILKRYVANAFDNPNQMVLGKTFKATDSALRTAYKRLMKSPDQYQQELGKAVRELHTSLLDMGKRQNPVKGAMLDKADVAYAKLSTVEKAAGYTGADDRVFNPTQMLAAIKSNSSKKAFAAGKGFDQKATEAAKEILPSKIPDSGTPGRLLMNGATVAGGFVNPGILAGAGAGAGLYTQPGVKLMQHLIASRPQGAGPLRKVIEESPILGLLGTAGAINAQ